MKRFIEGRDRDQSTLFPERLDDAIDADNPVRVVDAFIDALDLAEPGFDIEPEATGRPGYHPATMLKIYLYGYLNPDARAMTSQSHSAYSRLQCAERRRHEAPSDRDT
jgi:transposase